MKRIVDDSNRERVVVSGTEVEIVKRPTANSPDYLVKKQDGSHRYVHPALIEEGKTNED